MHDLATAPSRRAVFATVTSRQAISDQSRIGFWLRMARERANLSQPAAARMLGLSDKSASTMSAWEAGTREPSPSKLKAMSALYEVPLTLFYDPPPTAIEQIDAMAAGQRLSGVFSTHPEATEALAQRLDALIGSDLGQGAVRNGAHTEDRADGPVGESPGSTRQAR